MKMRRKKTAIRDPVSSIDLDATLGSIIDSLEDEIIVVDRDYRVSYANSVVLNRFRDKTESLIGGLCYPFFNDAESPCSSPTWDCPLRRIFESGEMVTLIHSEAYRGKIRYIKITAHPVKDSEGCVTSIVEIRRDVTVERELERQILRRYHYLLALSRISSTMTGQLDLDDILKNALDNVLEIINGAIGGILLLDDETKMLYYRVQHGLSAKYAEEMRMSLGEGIAGRVAQTGESILLEDISKDQRTVRPDLVNAEGLKSFISIPLKSREEVVGVMNIASPVVGRFDSDNISLLNSIGDYLGTAIEQARLYLRLARQKERYKTLLQYSFSVQEKERKRIARELHDETSQALTSLSLSLQALLQMAEMQNIGDNEFRGKLAKAQSCSVQAGNEIVKLMKELRPTLLDELGMSTAIQRYAKDTLQAKNIDVSIEFDGKDERLPPEIEVTLFRIAQGAIGNILEHSEAKKAVIKLKFSDQECQLRIEDDGKGFDSSRLTKVDSTGRGAGLFTIKERVRLIGGACRVESQPDQGTRITVKIPLEKGLSGE
jgi:signal transduction histidine kinase